MSDRIIAPRSVPHGTYGSATEGVNFILGVAHKLVFFRPIERIDSEVLQACARYCDRYERALGQTPPNNVMAAVGDAAALRLLRRRIANDARSEATIDHWTAALSRHVSTLRSGVADKASIFKPPLWEFPEIPNVVKQLSIASPKDVLAPISEQDRDVYWQLACDVDVLFWSALDWEVIHRGSRDTNPYLPLINLIERGLYPLGFDDGVFVIFGRATAPLPATTACP
jgi:hypothetical protein